MQLEIDGLAAQLTQSLLVARQSLCAQPPVAQVVQDVAEVRAVAVDENGAVVLLLQAVPTGKHGRQHGVRLPGQGQLRGREQMAANIELDPTLQHGPVCQPSQCSATDCCTMHETRSAPIWSGYLANRQISKHIA